MVCVHRRLFEVPTCRAVNETLFGDRVFESAMRSRCSHSWTKVDPKSSVGCPCKRHTIREEHRAVMETGTGAMCLQGTPRLAGTSRWRCILQSPAKASEGVGEHPECWRLWGHFFGTSSGTRSLPGGRIRVPESSTESQATPASLVVLVSQGGLNQLFSLGLGV